jgi:hypothetical protein
MSLSGLATLPPRSAAATAPAGPFTAVILAVVAVAAVLEFLDAEVGRWRRGGRGEA